MSIDYPADIKPLTGLRFVAALWVLLYHFGDHLGLNLRGQVGLFEHGNLGVDLFFLLSGFILTHVYVREVENRTYNHLGFLWNRIARVYPLHLITLAAMLGIWGIGKVLNLPFEPSAFRVSDLPFHLTMTHAWGTVPNVGWNFPSWSVSAEWFAYCLFPAFAFLASLARKRPVVGLILASYVFIALYIGLEAALGMNFTDNTAPWGAARIIPSFLIGTMLYQVGRRHTLSPNQARWLLWSSVFLVVLVCTLQLKTALAWPGLAGAILALGEQAKHNQRGALGTPQGLLLGEASYAMYMCHLPVDIVWFKALGFAGVSETSQLPIRLAALVGALLATFVVAILLHLLIERPSRDFLRRLARRNGWFKPKGGPAVVDVAPLVLDQPATTVDELEAPSPGRPRPANREA